MQHPRGLLAKVHSQQVTQKKWHAWDRRLVVAVVVVVVVVCGCCCCCGGCGCCVFVVCLLCVVCDDVFVVWLLCGCCCGGMNWQPGASTPKRRSKNAVKIRRKIHAIITGVSHVELEKDVQFSKCELRGAKLHPEASTGHSSPFKPNGEETLSGLEKKHFQDSSLPQRRKCVKSYPKAKVLA